MSTIRDARRYTNGILNAISSPRVRNWVGEDANALFHQIATDDGRASGSQEFSEFPSDSSLSLEAEELFLRIRVIGGRIRRLSVSPSNIAGAEVDDEVANLLLVVEELKIGEKIRLAGRRWPTVSALTRFDNLGLLVIKGKGEILIQKLDPADSVGGSI